MKIVDSHGNEITSLEDWANLYAEARRERHWKKGRSAYSVAEFILNRGGAVHLESRLFEVLKQSVSIRLVNPEKEVRFDKFGRGRVHDLAIEGIVGGEQSLFLGLEAKVDESFGPIIQDQLESAQKQLSKNPRSKAVERIRALPARYSPSISLDSMLDIRYQLVHGTAGTVSARKVNREPYDLYVFYVLVFKTCLHDEKAGEQNLRDYLRFISRVGGSDLEHPDVRAHSITMDDKPLTCIYEYVELPA